MRKTFYVSTDKPNGMYDITEDVKKVVSSSKVGNGIANVYVRHATAAIMIQENWDESVQTDVINLLKKLIPNGVWLHDEQDGNGDAHLKSGIVGPSETIPLVDGNLALGRWQNVFLCEFDGPKKREIVVTVIGDS
jgi:secondary thiamine-phosphate synthase enzyme